MMSRRLAKSDDDVVHAFKVFDRDGDGLISSEELRAGAQLSFTTYIGAFGASLKLAWVVVSRVEAADLTSVQSLCDELRLHNPQRGQLGSGYSLTRRNQNFSSARTATVIAKLLSSVPRHHRVIAAKLQIHLLSLMQL